MLPEGSRIKSCQLPESDPSAMDFGGGKAWKDIWGCGQGIGAIRSVASAAQVVDKLEAEYAAAMEALTANVR